MFAKKSHLILLGVPMLALSLNSCGLDEPFANSEGQLHIRMQINSDVTRAETDATDLTSSLKLYISQGDKLYYKFSGLQEVPDIIPFPSGIYKAEAYAGTKSPASFTDKYYEGASTFEITTGVTNVTLECKIANVVAAVNASSIHPEHLQNYTITVGHSGGSLIFNEENVPSEPRAYYYLPEGESSLTYTVEGDNASGEHFVKSGVIEDVEKGHLYNLSVKCNPDYVAQGGAYLDVIVDDSEILVEGQVTLTAAPEITGMGFDLSSQIKGTPGSFDSKIVRVRSFGTLAELHLSGLDAWLGNTDFDDSCNILSASGNVLDQLSQKGISFVTAPDPKNPDLDRMLITFDASLLNALPEKSDEYVLDIRAVDTKGKTTEAKLRLANTQSAIIIDDPVVVYPVDQEKDQLAVSARSASLSAAIADPDAVNPGIRFREVGTETWQFAPAEKAAAIAKRTRALSSFTVKLSNLKPGTRYEYQPIADGFEPKESYFFTTEQPFTIPNASFEQWDTYKASTLLGTKNVIFPGSGQRSFWDSGNEGAATASMVLTDKSTDMVHSGTYSCRLASAAAMGMLAAGNLFAGTYVRTDGTNGVLQFGRQYNGSHPSALRLWANYRPGVVDIVKDSSLGMSQGDIDNGQIYVALTTAPIDIRTKPSERALFDKDSNEVLAYGQMTWDAAFGPDGSLALVTIPLTYKASAASNKPLYVVIVCSASRLGDYFTGSTKSVMYVDDFEFVYE